MLFMEKLAIFSLVGLFLGIPLLAARKDIQMHEDLIAVTKGNCASFQENKDKWIANGSPGGYEALRGMLQGDSFCRGYMPYRATMLKTKNP